VFTKNRERLIEGGSRHAGWCALSQTVRKRIEETFGWTKSTAGLRKTRHRGLARVVCILRHVRRHVALAERGHEGGYIGGLVGAPGTSAESGGRAAGGASAQAFIPLVTASDRLARQKLSAHAVCGYMAWLSSGLQGLTSSPKTAGPNGGVSGGGRRQVSDVPNKQVTWHFRAVT